jgi:hypothetical protein
MTESTFDTGVLRAVAVHTTAHADVGFAGEPGPGGYRAVTLFTCISGSDVRTVAEVNEAWDFIHANPFNIVIVFSGVASAAYFGFRKGHRLTRVGIGMTRSALKFQVPRMQLVTIGNGLWLWRLRKGRHRREK